MNQMTQFHKLKGLVLRHFNLNLSNQLRESTLCHGASGFQVVVLQDLGQLIFVVPGLNKGDLARLIRLSAHYINLDDDSKS